MSNFSFMSIHESFRWCCVATPFVCGAIPTASAMNPDQLFSAEATRREINYYGRWSPYLCVNRSKELSILIPLSRQAHGKAYELCICREREGTPVVTLLTDSSCSSDSIMGRVPLESAITTGYWEDTGAVQGVGDAVQDFYRIMRGVVARSKRNDSTNDMIKKTLVAIIDSEKPRYRAKTTISGTLSGLLQAARTTQAAVDKLCQNLCRFSENGDLTGMASERRICNSSGDLIRVVQPKDSTRSTSPSPRRRLSKRRPSTPVN
ncbi:hypothetical protein NM688_g3340 [Phlebia brevispora]|uniref:Uncharacterized protein n=1 Tax=Phlebia brevispora TaxID=194682 RepID=A0ACC1T5Y5_9APHY|nr:hypothetical protein NM688_g3340 [Phlebia brevispora]